LGDGLKPILEDFLQKICERRSPVNA